MFDAQMTLNDPPNLREPWPDDDLESCGRCPVCNAEPRELVHSRLADRTFFAAPGEWSMWRCLECGSGYLDPRPNSETLHRAYATYYTHDERTEAMDGSVWSRVRFALGNDYRTSRFNAGRSFAIPLVGRLAAMLLPGPRTQINVEYRFLPAGEPGRRLLDVGCGNGEFLQRCRDSGWVACGVEPDPTARRLAEKDGFDVRASLDDWADQAGTFQHATASHVIEHVHEPGELLREVRSMLEASGTLFIQTPNIDAPTHLRFGANWRGLEPPRHLVLFSRSGLNRLLVANGFRILQWVSDRTVSDFLVEQSTRIAEGRDPYSGVPRANPPGAAGSSSAPAGASPEDEFLTVIVEAV
jgi:2-polyprenyl-3-methyl-5-hydroxy-6-metoxy-1,4-benzoquinol methylase